jgi:hypothetical protein
VILPPLGSPTAKFTFLPKAPTANAQVVFDGSTSTPGTGAILISDFNWNFGDGTSGTGKSVTHAFTTGIKDTTFVVTLTVTTDRAPGQTGKGQENLIRRHPLRIPADGAPLLGKS